MCSHREQARSHRAIGVALGEERDAAMRDGDTATARAMSAMGKAHLRAAEILEGAHAALGTACEGGRSPA
jgi:hypothetical protein